MQNNQRSSLYAMSQFRVTYSYYGPNQPQQNNNRPSQNNEIVVYQRLQQIKAVQQVFDQFIKYYNGLNKYGKQTRNSKQWRDYYVKCSKYVKQKLNFMQKDMNYVLYIKQILTKLNNRVTYFQKVMGNQQVSQELTNSFQARLLRKNVIPWIEKLLIYVGGNVHTSSQSLAQSYKGKQRFYYGQGGTRW